MSVPDYNQWGQPVGPLVTDWQTRPFPQRGTLAGRSCRLEPLDVAAHADDLYRANAADDGRMWTYLACGPFSTPEEYRAWMQHFVEDRSLVSFAIVDAATAHAIGVAAYLRITPEQGTIEVGHLAFSPALQRTVAATEAMALMMDQVFDDLGYRRYEWKCNALNTPSRQAAARLGFRYEGTFRQAIVVKGRSRDTAWFAVTDGEWPRLRDAFAEWLDPANFDAGGRQRQALSALTAQARVALDAGAGPGQRRE